MKLGTNILHIIIVGFIRRTRIYDIYKYIKDNFPDSTFDVKTVYEYHENFRKVVTFFTFRVLTLLNADGEWEVDEALVTSKKRDRRGRDARFNIWAFGLHSRLLNLSIVYLVPNRRKVTLYPLIQHFIQPGSTIYSDQFKTYVNTNTNPKRSLIEEFFPIITIATYG